MEHVKWSVRMLREEYVERLIVRKDVRILENHHKVMEVPGFGGKLQEEIQNKKTG